MDKIHIKAFSQVGAFTLFSEHSDSVNTLRMYKRFVIDFSIYSPLFTTCSNANSDHSVGPLIVLNKNFSGVTYADSLTVFLMFLSEICFETKMHLSSFKMTTHQRTGLVL